MSDEQSRVLLARQALFSGDLDVDDLDDVLALYRDLFDLARSRSDGDRDPRESSDEETSMRLAEGFTLIDPREILPRPEELAEAVDSVIEVLGRYTHDAASLRDEMKPLQERPERLLELARTYLTGGDEALRRDLDSREHLSPEVAMFVLFNALKGSFLRAAARSEGRDFSAWSEGRCPVCGGEPAVSYLLGEGGKRHLICHRCETRWRYRRLRCPFCGRDNPEGAGYLYSDERRYRTLSASVCGGCGAYIKTWRVEGDVLGEIHPEIEDLKTPGFDRAVEDEGYSRGAPNIFGVWLGTVEEDEEGEE